MKNERSMSGALVCGALLLLLGGCAADRPYAAYPIEEDAERDAHVVVTDGELLDYVRVGQPLVERLPSNNRLRVVIPLRNIHDYPIQFMAQMEFRDAMQRPIVDATNRRVMTIPSGMTMNYETVSKSDRAADYVLRLGPNR